MQELKKTAHTPCSEYFFPIILSLSAWRWINHIHTLTVRKQPETKGKSFSSFQLVKVTAATRSANPLH